MHEKLIDVYFLRFLPKPIHTKSKWDEDDDDDDEIDAVQPVREDESSSML